MDALLTLIRDYKEACSCHGDQYGSPGCCDLCKRAFEVLKEPKPATQPQAEAHWSSGVYRRPD